MTASPVLIIMSTSYGWLQESGEQDRCAEQASCGRASPFQETPCWAPGRTRPGAQRRSDDEPSCHGAVTANEPVWVAKLTQAPVPTVGRQETIAW